MALENTWTGEWGRLMVPAEEAEWRRNERCPYKPPYWGETEARARKAIESEGLKRGARLRQQKALTGPDGDWLPGMGVVPPDEQGIWNFSLIPRRPDHGWEKRLKDPHEPQK